MRTRQIQKFALFRKQRALIILWRTLDNKFAIKMNLNRRERAVLKHFCLSYCCLSCPTELQVWLPCFSPFMLAMKQPLVPLETDSTMLQLQIHSVASLYLMKGKSGNLLLMNLECKKNASLCWKWHKTACTRKALAGAHPESNERSIQGQSGREELVKCRLF